MTFMIRICRNIILVIIVWILMIINIKNNPIIMTSCAKTMILFNTNQNNLIKNITKTIPTKKIDKQIYILTVTVELIVQLKTKKANMRKNKT